MIPLYPNNIRFPALTMLLIATNILIFIYLSTLNQNQLTQVYYQYGIMPALCFNQKINFLTYGFIHDHLPHLLGNMWLLWLSGSILETYRTKAFYIAIFVFSAVITGIAFCLVNTGSTQILIGLSGAIAGIIGCIFVTADNTVRTYVFPVFIVDFNVKFLAATWFAIQCLLMILNPQSEVAFISHVTGFMIGAGAGILPRELRKSTTHRL